MPLRYPTSKIERDFEMILKNENLTIHTGEEIPYFENLKKKEGIILFLESF